MKDWNPAVPVRSPCSRKHMYRPVWSLPMIQRRTGLKCCGQMRPKSSSATYSNTEVETCFGGVFLLRGQDNCTLTALELPNVILETLMTWRGSAKRSEKKSLLRCVQTWRPTTRHVWPLWLPTRVLPPSTRSCFANGSNTYYLKCK